MYPFKANIAYNFSMCRNDFSDNTQNGVPLLQYIASPSCFNFFIKWFPFKSVFTHLKIKKNAQNLRSLH